MGYICLCLPASTSPSKVLRRSQFALKEKIEDDEGGDGSTGEAKAEAKAKGKPCGKAKAKAKGRPKGKAKVQAKKGNKPKDNPIQEEEEEVEKENDAIAEPSDNTTPGVPKDSEEKPVPKDDDVAKEDCPKDGDDVEDSKPTDPNQKQDAALTPREPAPAETTAKPKANATKKRKAKEVGEAQQDHSAGNEPTKPVQKRRTAKGDEGKDGKPAPAGPAKGEIGKEAKKRAAGQVKAEGKEEENKVKKKRVRSDEPATFARRVVPTTPFGKDKWYSLRSAFHDLIRPTVKHYSTHEDPWLLSFMYPMLVLKKCISGSISTNVGEAVQKFPCVSLPTFIPRYVCSYFVAYVGFRPH